MSKVTGRDRNGDLVSIGDRVKLLEIRPSILARLQGQERSDVGFMLGRELSVFDVYDNGQVWVILEWQRDEGVVESHSIAVDSHSIELVSSGAGRAV